MICDGIRAWMKGYDDAGVLEKPASDDVNYMAGWNHRKGN